jgi:hypothetical protein
MPQIEEIFADAEFGQMMFNVNKVAHNRSIFKAFPALNKVPELRRPVGKGFEKNRVMRYICLMYDKNSPFRRRFPDISKRKIEAAKHAGYKLEEGGIFAEKVEDMLTGKIPHINRMLVAYLRLHRNIKFSYLVSMEESFYHLMEQVTGGDMKNLNQLKEIQAEIEETMADILSDDNTHLIQDSVLKYIEDKRINLRPEDIARRDRKLNQPNAEESTEADKGEP